jgi:hypothetical protein
MLVANTMSAVLGGAAAGASSAAFIGADPLQGAGIGALSGAVFGGIGALGGKSWKWDLGRVALSGVAGGGISEMAGGSFMDGFAFAGSIAASDFAYRSIVSTQSQGRGQGSSMKTAQKNGIPKLDANGNALTIDGKPVVINERKYSNVGFASKQGASGFGHFIADETGPVMGFLGKYVPGFQGLSLAHDITGQFFTNSIGATINTVTLNFPTMPVIYGINAAGSLINDSPGMIGLYETENN